MDYKTADGKRTDAAVNELLLKIKAGDQTAFGCLADMYRALVDSRAAAFARGVLSGEYDDLRQEAVIALYDAALTYDPEKPEVKFGLFAKICINNRLSSKTKKIKRHADRVVTTEDLDCGDRKYSSLPTERGSISDEPSERLIEHEKINEITKVIKSNLSEYELKIYKIHIMGASAKEIANKLGKKERSVENAIYRIRSKLKKLL